MTLPPGATPPAETTRTEAPHDPTSTAQRASVRSLGRRVGAEALGTGFLVAAVIGSGIAASRLSPSDPGLQLLENSVATGAVLVALIVALQPISASFNPVVTLVERATGLLDTHEAAALIAGQLLGGSAGAVVANLMFDLPAVTVSTHARPAAGGIGQLIGELVATFGLVLLIFATVHGRRRDQVAYVVGAYITAAYWFTSSTSFANPAVTLARMLSDSFAGVAPRSVPAFIGMQLLGAAAAAAVLTMVGLLPRVLPSHLPSAHLPDPEEASR